MRELIKNVVWNDNYVKGREKNELKERVTEIEKMQLDYVPLRYKDQLDSVSARLIFFKDNLSKGK